MGIAHEIDELQVAVAQAVRMQYEVGKSSTLTSELSGFLMKVMSCVVIWAGTMLVFNGKLSIGVLIAFNMLAMRVTGPLVQMVGLVTKYQQTALSLRMLAGLEPCDSGEVRIGGRDVTTLQTRERNVAMVFQNGALFDSLSVGEIKNIGEKRAEELAALLGGRLETPRMSWKYLWIQKLFGWSAAKAAAVYYNQCKSWTLRTWDRTMSRIEGSSAARLNAL